METTGKKGLREPESEYDCWCMDCNECVHWKGEEIGCNHPERYLGNPFINK